MFGNIVRIMKYDRASNVANAIPALNFQGMVLNWHRLDDGVMGGQSETLHSSTITLSDGSKLEGLHFTGTINTKGGGFTSIRAPLEESAYLPKEAVAIKLKIRGDGKMYKILLSDGSGGFRGGLSFQADFPTKALADDDASQEITLPLESFIPSSGGSTIAKEKADFKAEKMRQIGLMLSLKLSDGSANPKESFGEGIFPFSLIVESLEIVLEGNEKKNRLKCIDST